MRTAKTPILTLKELTLAVLLAILLIGSITYANAQSTSLLKSDPQINKKWRLCSSAQIYKSS